MKSPCQIGYVNIFQLFKLLKKPFKIEVYIFLLGTYITLPYLNFKGKIIWGDKKA